MKKPLLKAILKDLGPILLRNIFSLVSVIIGGLSLILIFIGDTRDGFFLGLVITINIIIGITQELRSRIALEKLQTSIATKYSIQRGSKELKVLAEEICVGDIIKTTLGDQVPVDGIIIKSSSCECNEAMLTGESDNITKRVNDKLLAGSIIVAGSAELKAEKTAESSYLATMTESLKKYSRNLSPIQRSMLTFIQQMAVILVIIAVAILIRSHSAGGHLSSAINQIAAIASTIIAEGLVLTSTVFFTYGAIKMSQQKVLLQQINSIEILGRVATVCVDKTGTLTENQPVFEKLISYEDSLAGKNELAKLVASYSLGESTNTSTMMALREASINEKPYKISDLLSFSSERKYAAFKLEKTKKIVIVGASDYFVNQLPASQKKWLESQLQQYTTMAKRVLFVGVADDGDMTKPKSLKNLTVSGLILMNNPLKAATKDIVNYLQDRGVQILVISGDNAKTVRAIADLAGIDHNSRVIEGSRIEKYSITKLAQLIKQKPLFARVLPSQKEQIIRAAQKSGPTAMIGDGANDALAIKRADVGIAMFSGAPASRQIADAILINDSFAALPAGVKLSDTIITTLEMIACLFFSRVWSGVLLLAGTLVINVNYPFTPRNITLLNLFIVGFPIFLWGIWPRSRERSIHDASFLKRTLPFSITNGTVIALLTLITYYIAISVFNLSSANPQIVAYICFAIMSVFTISIIPGAMQANKNSTQQAYIYLSYVVMGLVVVLVFWVHPLSNFFGLDKPTSILTVLIAIIMSFIGITLQKLLANNHFGDRLYQKLYRKN